MEACISALDSLRQYSRVVADTGDFLSIEAYKPEDATTNPSLIYRAVQQDRYRGLLHGASQDSPADQVDAILVRFGREILRLIPGRVSTEVDARLSFDSQATFDRAMALAERYARAGVAAHRVLIKIAATWEGIEAARRLEQHGVRCNLTLVFSLTQARACADAGVQLISPFVGRITDWYKAREGRDFAPHEDPGVESVRRIHAFFTAHNYPTEIMGASFRNTGQILALAGCDLLTISPPLLGQLQAMQGPVERQLSPGLRTVRAPTTAGEKAPAGSLCAEPSCDALRPAPLGEAQFRWLLNDDAMATEKLAEGIRIFAADGERLEQLLRG